jgi:hypothetical protein
MPWAAKAVTGLLKQVRGMQQRLGRNAADVQAGAAETRLALRVGIRIGFAAGGRETELGGADRRDVAAGTGTDDEDVELLGHVFLSLKCEKSASARTGNLAPGPQVA